MQGLDHVIGLQGVWCGLLESGRDVLVRLLVECLLFGVRIAFMDCE